MYCAVYFMDCLDEIQISCLDIIPSLPIVSLWGNLETVDSQEAKEALE